MLFQQSQDRISEARGDPHSRGLNPDGNYLLVPLDCYVENGALLQIGFYEPISNQSIGNE